MGKTRRILKRILLVLLGLVLIGFSLGAAFFSAGKWGFFLRDQQQAETLSLAPEVQREGVRYELNENVIPILFIGCDQENGRVAKGYNGQGDAFILMAVDTVSSEVTLIPVSRNIKTEIEVFTPLIHDSEGLQEDYLCLAYSYGQSNQESGELCCDAVSRLLGIPVSSYYILEMSGVGALADAVGGVELTVLEDVFRTDMEEGQTLLLQGQDALNYVWQRDVRDDYSSSGRSARQVQFARAFAYKALEAAQDDPGVLLSLLEVAQAYSDTNIAMDQLAYLTLTMARHGTDSFDVRPLPGKLQPLPMQMSEFVVDEQGAQELLLDVFYRPVSTSD